MTALIIVVGFVSISSVILMSLALRQDLRQRGIISPRTMKDRIWFYKPEWYFGWYWDKTISVRRRLLRIVWPVYFGGDEWDWHTVMIGWTFTGRIIIATRRCPQTGACDDKEPLRPDWPADND